jgi:hypothetical protein
MLNNHWNFNEQHLRSEDERYVKFQNYFLAFDLE